MLEAYVSFFGKKTDMGSAAVPLEQTADTPEHTAAAITTARAFGRLAAKSNPKVAYFVINIINVDMRVDALKVKMPVKLPKLKEKKASKNKR